MQSQNNRTTTMTPLEKQMVEAILNENPRDCPLHQVQRTLERYQQVIAHLYNELKAKTEACKRSITTNQQQPAPIRGQLQTKGQ